jgi:hypothetical protein
MQLIPPNNCAENLIRIGIIDVNKYRTNFRIKADLARFALIAEGGLCRAHTEILDTPPEHTQARVWGPPRAKKHVVLVLAKSASIFKARSIDDMPPWAWSHAPRSFDLEGWAGVSERYLPGGRLFVSFLGDLGAVVLWVHTITAPLIGTLIQPAFQSK